MFDLVFRNVWMRLWKLEMGLRDWVGCEQISLSMGRLPYHLEGFVLFFTGKSE